MNHLMENWEQVLLTMKAEYDIPDIQYNTWLKPLKVHSVEGNTVTIVVPSEIAGLGLNYISNKYRLLLQITISMAENMEDCEVCFIAEQDVPKKEVPKTYEDHELDSRFEAAGLYPKYTFDTFVVGSNNKFAQAAALAVAESPGKTYNPLFIYGGAGLGKTHLMHSIAHYILENNQDSKVLYVTSDVFTNELIDCIRNGNNTAMNKFREKYRNIDVLLIDDIQFIIGKDSTQEEFFHTFNSLHSAKKQIVISSDKPPRDMEILEERFRSRFEWGLIADIKMPDYETRVAILQKKAELENVTNIEDEVYQYIAENVKSSIRELEGALNKLIAYSRLHNLDITLPIAEEELKDIIFPDEKKVLTADDIVKAVADQFHISVDDIKGIRRNSNIVTARQICMYLLRDLLDINFKSIGKLLGNKDHSTVMHSVKKIEDSLTSDEEIRTALQALRKKLPSSM